MSPLLGPFIPFWVNFWTFLGLLGLILDTLLESFWGVVLGLLGLVVGPGASWGSSPGPSGAHLKGFWADVPEGSQRA